MTVLHGCEFWGVDKVKSAANFCKCPLALYLEQHSNSWGFTGRRQPVMRTSILSPGSEYVPVGHMCKFFHEQYEQRNFGVKWNFSKIRIDPVMLIFLTTFKKLRNTRSEQPGYNRKKVVKKAAGNCNSQFPDIKITRE